MTRSAWLLAESAGVPVQWQPFWQIVSITQWSFFNVITILLNNQIFQEFGFAFPLTLTAIHFAISYFGALVCIEVLRLRPRVEVGAADQVKWVLPMAAVTCFNVVLGNLSLRYIPLALLQAIKALAPALTVAIQWVALKQGADARVCFSLVPVVGGAVLSYAPEVKLVVPTLVAALLSALMGSATVVFAEALLHSKATDLDSINALYYMVPYSALILAPPAVVLEGAALLRWCHERQDPGPAVAAILFSGLIAFCLNFSLFYTIQATSALTFNVAGNFKVALTLMVSWLLFNTPVQEISALGCALTFFGVGAYGWALYRAQQEKLEARRAAGAGGGASAVPDDELGEVREGVGNYIGAWM